MVQICCAETSVKNYQYTTRKIAKERRYHSHPGGSLIHGRFPKRLNCSEMLLTCVSKDILSVKWRFSDLVMSFHFWQLLPNIRHLFLTRKAGAESHGVRVRYDIGGYFPTNSSAFFFPLYWRRTLLGDSKFTTGEVLYYSVISSIYFTTFVMIQHFSDKYNSGTRTENAGCRHMSRILVSIM
jgi:hypothetical protein